LFDPQGNFDVAWTRRLHNGYPLAATGLEARDPVLASRLWETSVELTGVGFDALSDPVSRVGAPLPRRA
jgi:hypothetical protein